MKIVHVPRRFVREAWGGTETVVLELAKRQLAKGDDVRILTTLALAAQENETIEGVDIRRFPYSYPYWGLSAAAREQMDRKGGNLVSFALYRELLAMPKPDVFHLHTGKRLGALVRTAASLRGVPYVVQLHGGLVTAPESEVRDLAEPSRGAFEWGKLIGLAFGGRRVVRDADAILCVDRFEAERLRELMPEKRIEFMPNGVDPSRFSASRESGLEFRRSRGIPASSPLVLTVGRIDPQKNQALALQALALVRKRLPEAMLAFAGPETNPAYRRKLDGAVTELGLSGAVLFLGQLDYSGGELASAYAAADCFLLSSVHEPFGVVALEAWAAGVPLAASRVGGIPAFVEDGANGLLFASDDASGASDALLRLLSDKPLALGLARRGKLDMEKSYTWDAISGRIQAIYEDAARACRGGKGKKR